MTFKIFPQFIRGIYQFNMLKIEFNEEVFLSNLHCFSLFDWLFIRSKFSFHELMQLIIIMYEALRPKRVNYDEGFPFKGVRIAGGI